MAKRRGDLSFLEEPLAQEILNSALPARLAYTWKDGTPRVVPMWFQWTGREVVLCSPANAPKMKPIEDGTKVALAIDYDAWPVRALTLRGTARCSDVRGEIPEYAAMTQKYLGDASAGWREQYKQMFPTAKRIAITPEWANLLDFGTMAFVPSALEAAMAR